MSEDVEEKDRSGGRLVGCLVVGLGAGLCLFFSVGIGGFWSVAQVLGGGAAPPAPMAEEQRVAPDFGPPRVPDRRNLDGPWQVQARFGDRPTCTFRISPIPVSSEQRSVLTIQQALGQEGLPCRTRILCGGELLFMAREGLVCDRRYGTSEVWIHSDEEAGPHAFELDAQAGTVVLRREDGGLLEGRIESIR